jgi:small subunit ribosomal protein S18
MSDRAKIRARRVTGNDSQQQREVARAIKNAREMALLPYTTRVTTQRKVKSSDNADRAAEPAEVEVEAPVLDDVDTADGADLAEVDA